MNRISLKWRLVEGPGTYDFTLHSRVRDHTTWLWRCVERPWDTFVWALTIIWTRLLARVWNGRNGHFTHTTSHYTWGFVTILDAFGGVLGQWPWDTFVEKKSMGGEMSFRTLVRPHHSFTSLFSHPCDKFQLTTVVIEVINYGEPSQSTKPTVTCL